MADAQAQFVARKRAGSGLAGMREALKSGGAAERHKCFHRLVDKAACSAGKRTELRIG